MARRILVPCPGRSLNHWTARDSPVTYFKYSIVYMSIPNSQFIPPRHLSPLVTISSFSKSVTLFLFHK